MKVHSIISNTISEETLETGHLSIRFLADGFSLLLEDKMYRPVILNRFTDIVELSLKSQVNECKSWLDRNAMSDSFKGEVSISFSSSSATLVPEELYSEDYKLRYLEQVARVSNDTSVMAKKIKERPFYLVFKVPAEIDEFSKFFRGIVRIFHSTEIIFSVADQVNASDHQRGFAFIELQKNELNILAIKEDNLLLSNRIKLKGNSEFLYHTLNTIDKLKLNRNTIPLFYAGVEIDNEEALASLKKYVKRVYRLPYSILDIEKEFIAEHIILAEGTRCA